MSDREQVLLTRAFVLHQRPYRNTSQLVDCLTAEHGRVTLVARGSRRPARGQRALLQPFLPLRLSWVRRGELGRLTHAEADGATIALRAERLLAGFYVNELLLRLTARGDANAGVFSCYSRCLTALADQPGTARALRLFELGLLQALGYGLALEHDIETGEPIRPEGRYLFEPEHGARAAEDTALGPEAHWGRELIALRQGTLDDEESLRAAKRLLGRALKTHLGERPLRTRLVFKEIIDRGL